MGQAREGTQLHLPATAGGNNVHRIDYKFLLLMSNNEGERTRRRPAWEPGVRGTTSGRSVLPVDPGRSHLAALDMALHLSA